MRILLISREYPPFVGGGIGTYAARWARLLAERGMRPVVVTTGPEGRMVEAEEDGVTVIRLPLVAHGPDGPDWSRPHPAIATPEVCAAFYAFHPTAVFAMQVARALDAILQRHAIDAIEAPDTGAPHWFLLNSRRCAAGSGKVAKWQSGKASPEGAPASAPSALCHSATLPLGHSLPILTHLHSPTEWIEAINGPETGRQMRELRRMEADVARWSDGLLAPSRAMADWAANHWGIDRARIGVIPYPIGELAAEPPHPPSTDSPLRLLFVGRLERRKGIDTLLAAVAQLARQSGGRLPLQLDLAGRDTHDPVTGELFGQSHIDRLLPPALRSKVIVHGELGPEAVRRLLAQADAAIVPSPLDNFPNTCIEAMSAARPVIGARAGGAAEMIEDGVSGLLFAPGNAAELARRLAELCAMTPEARRAMGAAARQRICSLCDDDAVLEARLEHIRSLEAPAPRGRQRTVVVLRRDGATDSEVAPLVQAVARGEPRFAHGWVRDVRAGRTVIDVFGTPHPDALRETPGPRGPIAVDQDLLAEAGIGPEDAERIPQSDLLARLIERAEGAVVPEAVIPTTVARKRPDAPATCEPEVGLAARLRRAAGRLRRLANGARR
ncbi:MAG: glycosyltransferase family 4 protein [Phycisphaerales bacterium JB039]